MKGENYETVPKQVIAKQWNKEGDHPKVVMTVSVIDKYRCGSCGERFQGTHGRIYSKEKGNISVCPGNYVVSIDNDFKVETEKNFKLKYRSIEKQK